MENTQLVIDSNRLCLFCLCKVKACKNHLFPLHHLTSKIDTNLGDVFQDMVVPGAPLPVLDRIKVFVVACEGCSYLCEELLYKYQEDVEMGNCVKLLFDKMRKVGLEDKYKNCESPLAVFHSGIVHRIRKEIIGKFYLQLGYKPNQLAIKTPAAPRRSPNRVGFRMPEFQLPIGKICSYLAIQDIKNLSLVSKDLRGLVFPSLIKSSFISFRNYSQIPTLISFIKDNSPMSVNLLIKSESLDGSEQSHSALLQLFLECGSQINHLKLLYGYTDLGHVVVNQFRDNNSIPGLGIGNELFPNMKALHINFYYQLPGNESEDLEEYEEENRTYWEEQIKAGTPFINAMFENSPNLKELELFCDYVATPSLFKLIGESAQGLDTLRTIDARITDEGLGYLHSLNLKTVDLSDLKLDDFHALTNFLQSQRNTLKHLSISSEEHLQNFAFPRMETLETLKVYSIFLKYTGNIGAISYSTQLPNLRKMELCDCTHTITMSNGNLLPNDANSTASVKILDSLCEFFDPRILTTAVSVVQCVSKLEIPVIKELFNFWKDLGSLEELTLYPSWDRTSTTWIDEFISGISYLYLENVITDKDLRRYAEKYEEVKTIKSLALLSRLRLLRLSKRRGSDRCLKVGVVGCKLVLMEMKSLKCIDFCGAHPSLVGASSKVLEEMGQKIKLIFGNVGEWQ